MKRISSLTLLLFLLFQTSFAQKKDVQKIFNEASESFESKDYETTLQKIKEIKMEYNNPPPDLLSMEILSKCEIIKKNPYANYDLIFETRKLTNSYLKNPISKKDADYNSVLAENKILNTYPKDLATFNAGKESVITTLTLSKTELNFSSSGGIENITINKNSNLYTIDLLPSWCTVQKYNSYFVVNCSTYNGNISRSDYFNVKVGNKTIKVTVFQLANTTPNPPTGATPSPPPPPPPPLPPFSSIGYQGGEIAKYGFLYERGGNKFFGFHISARTSATSEEEILKGTGVENKTEIELGPNLRIFNQIYLNIGLGYGYYDKPIRNDYAGTTTLEKTGYLLGTSGIMIRLSKLININGGVSFIDIDEAFYKPEITFGISFNLKKKNSY